MKIKKIAFCITCMNRLHHLQQTLEKNMQDNYLSGDVEFILLDYNSKDGLEQWVRQNMQPYIDKGILVYYKTFEPVHYLRSHSRNIAFRLSNAEILCNLDADNFLGEGFALYMIEEFAKQNNIFFTSDSRAQDTFGRICVKQKDFMSVYGYDEALQGYGFEDTNLFERLKKTGLKQTYFHNPLFYNFIRHTKAERIENEYMTNNIERMYISYLDPKASYILLLYKNHTFDHYTLVDSPHLYNLPESSYPADYNAKEDYWATITGDYQKGEWCDQNGETILILGNKRVTFVTDSLGIRHKERLYHTVSDEELKTELIIILPSAINMYMAMQQEKSGTSVNPDGFGKGKVYKNFNVENPILLS